MSRQNDLRRQLDYQPCMCQMVCSKGTDATQEQLYEQRGSWPDSI